jgi:DNA/RNA-binding domain of Phe-tRNA-synthetase-like protein
MPSMPEVRLNLDHPDLLIGLVHVDGLDVGPSDGPQRAWFDARLAEAPDPSESTRQAIRQLLKRTGFKATGRNKPASEYLVEARKRGELQPILDVVDVNNALSLETGWPMSVLDLGKIRKLEGDDALEIRVGRPDESYVFNAAGHRIDLENLLGVGKVGGPMLGNPVKDSMLGKVVPHTTEILAVLYTSRACATEASLRAVAETFAAQLGGGSIGLLPSSSTMGTQPQT